MIEENIVFPLEDIEEKWELVASEGRQQVYAHKDYKDLLRLIDFGKEHISFTDRKRVHPDKIIDINRALPFLRKTTLMMLLYRVIDAEKPIKMPYTHEQLKIYIEDLGDYVGVLHYMDSDKDKTIVPILRYFKHSGGYTFEEVSPVEYQKFKEENYVDSNTEQAENN